MAEAIFGLIGVLVGSGLVVGYSYYRDRKERDLRYKLMLYPKLVEVHQKAFLLLREFSDAVPSSIGDIEEARAATINEARCRLDEWWAANTFYLSKEADQGILDVLSVADGIVADRALSNYTIDKWHRDIAELRKCIRTTASALKEGIGMKHIEEPKKEQQGQDT